MEDIQVPDNVERRVMDPDKSFLGRTARPVAGDARAMAAAAIRSFAGEHEFLSTLSKSRVVLPGRGCTEEEFVAYPTVEHALQAAKSEDAEYRAAVLACKDPLEAKRLGAKVDFDKEAWKERSLVVMEALLRDKFRRHKQLRAQLLATGSQPLVYENAHNDQFWGVTKGKGSNHLGKLLEQVRADEREGTAGLLATLLWAKSTFGAVKDSTVGIEVSVTREGQPLPEAAQSLEKRAVVTFGKLSENDVVIAHPSSSRLHALVVVSERYGPLLVDLEAPNGTFLDERRLEPFKGALLVSGRSSVAFGTSSRRYTFAFDLALAAKKSLALYEVLEDPTKLAAERGDMGVFVSNLPKDVDEEALHEFFKDCGVVLQVALPRHKVTKEPRGFAIVEFGTEAAVLAALKLDRDPLKGTEIRIKRQKAKPKEEGQGASAQSAATAALREGRDMGGGGGGGVGRQSKAGDRGGGEGRDYYGPQRGSSGASAAASREGPGPEQRERERGRREEEGRGGGDRRGGRSRSRSRDRGGRRPRDDYRRDRRSRSRSRDRDRRRDRSRSQDRGRYGDSRASHHYGSSSRRDERRRSRSPTPPRRREVPNGGRRSPSASSSSSSSSSNSSRRD